jgi:hypothetical protein
LTLTSTSSAAASKSPSRICLIVLLAGMTMVGGKWVSGARSAAEAARAFC